MTDSTEPPTDQEIDDYVDALTGSARMEGELTSAAELGQLHRRILSDMQETPVEDISNEEARRFLDAVKSAEEADEQPGDNVLEFGKSSTSGSEKEESTSTGRPKETSWPGYALAASLGAAAIAALLAVQGPQQPNVSRQQGQTLVSASAVEQTHLARQVAAYGRENNDPQALITAAQMLSTVQGQVEALTKTVERFSDGEVGEKIATAATNTLPSILREAKVLATGRSVLLATIASIESLEVKGRASGPTQHVDRVDAYTIDKYVMEFRGGETAAVAISGDGDTDLDLFVEDANEQLVCAYTDNTDQGLCVWTPAESGNFTIRIMNHGNVWNEYELVTN